ncbi:MAG: hypothetical protein PHF84_06390 [bacterium]|nr:hypothetical protein [bacterium]
MPERKKNILPLLVILMIILYEIKTPAMIYEAIRIGQLILQHKTLNIFPLYQFTLLPGQEIINPQWLFQIFLACIHKLAGFEFISVLITLLIALDFFLIYKITLLETQNTLFSSIYTFLVFVLSIQFISIRPVLLAILFGLLIIYILRFNGKLYFIPFIHMLWINIHLSFPLCYLFLLAQFAETFHKAVKKQGRLKSAFRDRDVRYLLLIMILTAFSSLANPYGWKIFKEILEIFNPDNALSYITEWVPTIIQEPSGFLFFASSIIMIFILFRNKEKQAMFEGILFCVFYIYGLTAIRNILWWNIIVLPLCAGRVYSYLNRTRVKNFLDREYFNRPAFNCSIIFLLIMLIILASPYSKYRGYFLINKKIFQDTRNDPFSLQIIDYLKKKKKPGIQGRIMLYNEETSFFQYSLVPEYGFFTGGLIGYFKKEIRDYQLISAGIYLYDSLLDKYRINYLILHKDIDEQYYLIQALLKNKKYRLVLSDRTVYFFERI